MVEYIIANEDCQITMARMGKVVDTILTSPPYNMTNRRGGYADKGDRYDVYKDWKTEAEYIEWVVGIFKDFDKVLKPNDNILFNLSYSIENPMLPFKVMTQIDAETTFTVVDTIIWKKKNCVLFPANRTRLSRICEFVFVLSRKTEVDTFITNRKHSASRKSGQDYYDPVVNYIEAKNNDGVCDLNKATYSVELCAKLLGIYTPQGSTVYDPFNGTGTTGVACVKMQMAKYIGSEISKAQCDYSIERIKKHKAQVTLYELIG